MELSFEWCGDTPGVLATPEGARGAVLTIHGYGGCKEEIAGLALRISSLGFATYSIDLQGHGENRRPLGRDVALQVAECLDFCRRYGKVAAVGHSLGGRLALVSDADFAIGISPALPKRFSDETRAVLSRMRRYRVVESHPGVLWEILAGLPTAEPSPARAVLYGTRDVPEIVDACRDPERGFLVTELSEALHNDTYLLERTFAAVAARLDLWF